MAAQRVAVIGAGASGLCALKCCLDEGLEPTCFERSKDIGGLWRFEVSPEQPGCSLAAAQMGWRSNSGMEAWNSPVQALFQARLVPNPEQDAQGYRVSSMLVMPPPLWALPQGYITPVGHTGASLFPKHPTSLNRGQPPFCSTSQPSTASLSLPGLEKFEGCYLHSRDYKSPQPFMGKRVVVVGIGNSGIDIAVELSHTAKQVFLSTRRGSWVLHRVADNGYPFDFSYLSRFLHLVQNVVPSGIINFFMERKLNARFDHTLYGLKPEHGILDQHPTVNDDLPNRIISGRVRVKPNIQQFTEMSAIFEDGTREDVDAVVFATGYSFSFPFLEGCVKVVENQIPLYKFMFPPELEKPTLAFIGLIQPLGAIMPISELQCRWATCVFKGLQGLPPPADMLADITQTKQRMAERYVQSQRHTIQVDYIPYMDELACQLGVKPNLLSLFLTDPKLAMEVAFGPCTPYQYRLRGPGSWAGAREAILTQRQRMVSALQPRAARRPARGSAAPHLLTVLLSIGLIVATLVYVSLSP
ncbi:FMO5 monooxygenase, partial [Prunella fulvescens]|nr:FMO5 monooxygenase [Prunella fulvescens]